MKFEDAIRRNLQRCRSKQGIEEDQMRTLSSQKVDELEGLSRKHTPTMC